MASNPAGLTVLFGGGAPGSTALADTWELASPGGSWQQLTSTAGTAPSGRTLAAMVWDPSLSKFVLFGGLNGTGFQGGTYAFDPTTMTWSELTTTGSPTPRAGAALAALPDGEVLLFGGLGSSGFLSDTWVFDPATTTWSKQSGSGPTARYEAAMSAGPAGPVLFGGLGPSGLVGGTWAYNPADGTWSQATTSGSSPSARYGAGFAYDVAAGDFVLFGGDTASGYSSATYTYDPATAAWATISPTTSPSPRDGAGLTYDATAHAFVLFGGWDGANFLSDTWELAG